MSATAAAALSFALLTTLIHLVTIGIVIVRARRSRGVAAPAFSPDHGITLVRTVRDADKLEEETLASSFALTHPNHEVLFCATSDTDPAVRVVQRLMRRFPNARARLLVGDDRISANPKLNNMVKGWREARHSWIVFSDSNVLLPPDYLERVAAAWGPDTGLVCAPPVGSRPDGWWAEVECAFLNTYQARWQYAADSLGLGFAQGKTMMFHRSVLEWGGGIGALARELSEDAAATKVVRDQGLRVRLAGPSFFQPLGARSAANVLGRQLRWAQLRRATFPGWFGLEILTGCLLPLIAVLLGAPLIGLSPLLGALGLAAVWLGAEAALAWMAGWHLSWRAPLAWLLRDILIAVVWLRAWTARSYEWRGHKIAMGEDGAAQMIS